MRSACSSDERRRRSGQASSWTWATTTNRHSRPLERWAVSSRTASPRRARPALVGGGGPPADPPLQALGAVGGEQPDRFAAHPSLGERVTGDLLGPQRRQEAGHAGMATVLLRTRGHLEERTDGVEVAVRE